MLNTADMQCLFIQLCRWAISPRGFLTAFLRCGNTGFTYASNTVQVVMAMMQGEAAMVPEDVGRKAAHMLLEEIDRGGVTDGTHQVRPSTCRACHSLFCFCPTQSAGGASF